MSYLLCFLTLVGIFPHTALAVPLVAVLSFILTEPSGQSKENIPRFPNLPSEGSAEWFANLRAIQNLLGAV